MYCMHLCQFRLGINASVPIPMENINLRFHRANADTDVRAIMICVVDTGEMTSMNIYVNIAIRYDHITIFMQMTII